MSDTAMKNFAAIWLAILFLCNTSAISHGQLLENGDFELPAIVGDGQTPVDVGGRKSITRDPAHPSYLDRISGIESWTYSTPFDNGTRSDHGLARVNDLFGLDPEGQAAYINNWGRMMSQTVQASVIENDVARASINFATLGQSTDGGRAGRFFLVAGEADPNDLDSFSARSIILDELSIANPTWDSFVPDFTVDNDEYFELELEYRYLANDPALDLPLTVAFLTVGSSVGSTYWDDASLRITQVPEPSVLPIALFMLCAYTTRRNKR